MKVFFTLTFFFIFHFASAQVFETAVDVGFNFYHDKIAIIQASDGGFIVGGSGDWGYASIVKIDSNGYVVWARKYRNGLFGLAPLGANHFVIYDIRDSSAWGTHEFGEISVFDSDGSLVTAFTIPESLFVEQLHPTDDGGTIAFGVPLPPNGNGKSMILKTDSSANFQWIKFIDDTTNGYNVQLSDIIQANSGGFIGLGSYRYPDTLGSPDYQLLAKLDSAGDTIWTKSFDSVFGSRIYNATENGFMITGLGPFSPNPTITLLDSVGNIKWSRSFPSNLLFNIHDFVLSSDSNFVFSTTDYYATCLLKIDTTGNILWMHNYPTPANYNSPNTISNSTDNGFALFARDEYANIFTLIKTDSMGVSTCDSSNAFPVMNIPLVQSTPTYYGIHPISYSYQPYLSTEFPFFLDSIYTQFDNCLIAGLDKHSLENISITIHPNPATSQTAISCSIPIGIGMASNSQLEIFNSRGEKIYSTNFRGQSTVDCRYFPKGIYFVCVSNSEKVLTKKLLIE